MDASHLGERRQLHFQRTASRISRAAWYLRGSFLNLLLLVAYNVHFAGQSSQFLVYLISAVQMEVHIYTPTDDAIVVQY